MNSTTFSINIKKMNSTIQAEQFDKDIDCALISKTK